MLKKLFGFDPAQHSVRTEVLAGITTFLTMSYILAVNPNIFKELEGIDIHPAPAVALASLIKMVESGSIDKDACIMLNITGAGEEAAKKNRELFYLKPVKTFSLNATVDDVVNYVETLF